MDRQQILALLTRLETDHLDVDTLTQAYAETLAMVSERLTVEEMRRFLFVGSYLCHATNNKNKGTGENQKLESWRGNLKLH